MQCYALVMRINWKDIFKFLSGAFLCHGWGELVSVLVPHRCSFVWIHNDTRVFGI